MQHTQMVLDAIVRFRIPFVHQDGLRRVVPLRSSEFSAALNALLADRLIRAAGEFAHLTERGIYVGATGALRHVGLLV